MTLNEKLLRVKAYQDLIEEIKKHYALISSIPTDISDLNNDQNFQTASEVETAIKTAISKTGHASFKKADSVPSPDTAEDNVLYLVKNTTTNHYDIYAKIDGAVELIDDTTVDLTNYVTTDKLTQELAKKVDKVTGKDLSTNDYTNDDQEKLQGISTGANKVEESSTNGYIKIDGSEKKVYELTEEELETFIATDEEITEMLSEAFGDD